MALLMKREVLEDIKAKAVPVLTQAGVKKAALFGSYARGTNTQDSDVDILVELPEDATLFELGGLKVDLEEILKKNVDVLTYKSLSSHIKESILNNQYPLL
jgi:uncharacterized protein